MWGHSNIKILNLHLFKGCTGMSWQHQGANSLHCFSFGKMWILILYIQYLCPCDLWKSGFDSLSIHSIAVWDLISNLWREYKVQTFPTGCLKNRTTEQSTKEGGGRERERERLLLDPTIHFVFIKCAFIKCRTTICRHHVSCHLSDFWRKKVGCSGCSQNGEKLTYLWLFSGQGTVTGYCA